MCGPPPSPLGQGAHCRRGRCWFLVGGKCCARVGPGLVVHADTCAGISQDLSFAREMLLEWMLPGFGISHSSVSPSIKFVPISKGYLEDEIRCTQYLVLCKHSGNTAVLTAPWPVETLQGSSEVTCMALPGHLPELRRPSDPAAPPAHLPTSRTSIRGQARRRAHQEGPSAPETLLSCWAQQLSVITQALVPVALFLGEQTDHACSTGQGLRL